MLMFREFARFLSEEGGVRVCVCFHLMMTALCSPTIISHQHVLKQLEQTDSVGLMEVELGIAGADGMSLIVF